MADSIRSRPHTRSRSRVLSTGGHPPGAFESSIVETPSRFEAGLNSDPDTVRLAPRSTRQLDAGSLDENNGHPGVYRSGEAISDQQMKHLKMMLEMDKGKQRVLELELQLEKLCQQRFSSFTDQSQNVNNHSVTTSTATWNPNLSERLEFNLYELNSRVGKAISQFKEDVKNTRNNRLRTLYKEMMNGHHSGTPETGVRPHFSKYDENRIAYTLWNAIEQEYSVLKTQLHHEAVLEFMSLGGIQVINLHTFFDKFRSAIMKLEMLDASPSDAWIFDTFYSVLPNNWRNYVQKKIEEIQDSKSTAVVLDVDLLMEEIRSRLDPPKDKKNLQNIDSAANSATTATTHNLKVLPNAARKAAAAIPSATPGLPTAARQEIAAIPDPSIDNLFIDEEIRPECPLFLVPTNNWWIDYDISARIPTLLVQNTLNSPEPTVESDDPPTSTRDITIVRESTVGESSVGDSLEDLPTDPEIAALPILKNLTRAKASMEWKYYYKARVKEVNRLKYTRWKENIKKIEG
ncbi:uncharacterized protein BDCG_06593 [Blastomyces dermatitidis ER-3]|uniref:Uncharacterized protein n=1 Tax=Ajellomyces dermatitidis (strain ER-3 / ATCC MYA-2586) TaxID=559297 RepID=A0ABP2F3N3_AJEDR|nr:uncharacterized protein BDCG_06593 [Blastomyces dermatitidis ER-3]EEQ91473.2 hypothetical protein BDCG_06593 [Blastomyces dermatitidis ER-3]